MYTLLVTMGWHITVNFPCCNVRTDPFSHTSLCIQSRQVFISLIKNTLTIINYSGIKKVDISVTKTTLTYSWLQTV